WVLIIGAMMPSAPKSSARLAVANSPTGMRTIAAAPPWRTCATPDTIEAVSQSPCCPSSVTAGKPSRPTSSATIGEDRPHQPPRAYRPGDDRGGWAAPAAVDGFAGAQPAGKREGACCRHGENRPLLSPSARSPHHASRDGGSRPAGIEWLLPLVAIDWGRAPPASGWRIFSCPL